MNYIQADTQHAESEPILPYFFFFRTSSIMEVINMTLEVFRRLNVGDKVRTYSKHPKARYNGVVCVVIDKIEEKKPENYRNRGLVLIKPIEGQLWTHKDQHPWEGKFNDTVVTPVMRVYDAKFITLISKKAKVRRAP